ncbi:MAG: TonB family protein [Dongiaceae bacterium]
MNAGLVEWGSIAKSIAYGSTLTGTIGRGALLLSALVHGGLAAAFIGWGEPQPTAPQPIPIAIVAVASGNASGGASAPVIAQAPHQPATRPAEPAEPAQAEMPEPPIAPLPQSAALERPEPVPLASEPVADMALPAIEPLPAPAAKPPEPPAELSAEPRAEQLAATEPVPEAAPQSVPEPVIQPAAPAMIEIVPTQTAPTETAPTETAPTETATETAPAIAMPSAGQTAALPDPASALGTAPDTLETGSADFEPARYDVAALANPEPDYPWASRRAGEQGRVVLRVEVSAGGIVEAIGIADSSGHRRLDNAALEAVRHWRFEPARIGDQAIATTVNVPVTFRLE